MNTVDLLIGPRGRRLCLEWVRRLSAEQARGHDALGEALVITGNAMDPQGTSWIFAVKESADDPEPELPSPSSAGEIADLISGIRLRSPTEREILQLLSGTTGSAVYWQPLWGEDRLAAADPIRRALEPAAKAIAGSPAAAWWDCPNDRVTQWTTAEILPDEPLPALGTDNSGALLSAGRQESIEEEQRFRTEYDGEDVSGVWTSTPAYRLTSSTRYLPDAGPAGMWFKEDAFGADRTLTAPLLAPTGPRVLEIDGPDDWAGLCAAFPLDVTASRRYVWGEATGRTGGWLMPDWVAVADSGIDAVHLTVAGYLTTAGRALPVTATHSTVLAGWDPDATFWLVDVAAGDPVVWEMDRESEDLTYHRVTME
ncbi:hypothetical protein [Acidipropionibacterium virtanenii]|uniref:Uncharacterized protein n=1 Tax=Acidipropionibacterium virtanenii TaxID=2057246 RepID=A0A344UQT7_9ACTN|nr:hypothetical protein [Acidipropionibacterium virtanenii]AXE37635.1 hypothetical protein JS278_00442 [Acidipropionibacterium virtanenii]